MDRNKKAVERFKEKHTKKILIYGATCNGSTGNSKLIYHMAKSFQKGGHEVFTVGLEYNRPQIYYDGILILPSFNCEKCGNSYKGSSENVQKIADWVNSIRPDVFICVGDPFQMQQFGIGNIKFELTKNTKAVMYATIDSFGKFCNENLLQNDRRDYLEICDEIVSTSQFTKEQFKYWNNYDSPLIYETIDLTNYKTVSEEEKKTLREKYRFKEKDYVMYYCGRNIMRKRVHTLLEATVKFLIETKDTYLYINIPFVDTGAKSCFPDCLNPIDFIKRVLKKHHGRDLIEEGRIIFAKREQLGGNDIGEKQHAEFYQLSDVYVTTSPCEGFGLTLLEALACGIPVICPNYTTGTELLGGKPLENCKPPVSLPPGFTFAKGGLLTDCPIELWQDHNLKQYLTTTENTYNAMKFLYNDGMLREQMGKEGREHALKTFNQDIFTKKWLELVKNIKKKDRSKQEFKTITIGGEKDE